MNPRLPRVAAQFLRGAGTLLMILGVVHLVATPHIPQLLHGASSEVWQRALGPMLLNHVLVGIFLLPLGYTTWVAAAEANRTEKWARPVLIVNALTVFTMPASVAALMRQPEYYHAPLFVVGVALVAVISLIMMAAAYVLLRE